MPVYINALKSDIFIDIPRYYQVYNKKIKRLNCFKLIKKIIITERNMSK